MATVNLYRMDGTKVGTKELPDRIFGVTVKPSLVEQAVVTQRANARVAIAHTKTRSEVRGGGRKPWKQKGTGRARHGSIRSPIWRGGGVTFGPRSNRNFSKKMNKKERQKALFMTLSDKVASERLVLLDKFEVAAIKTKAFATIMKKLPVKGSVLLVLAAKDPNIEKSARNIQDVTTILGNSLNVIDVMNHKYLVMPQQSIDVIEKTYHA